MVLNMMKSWGNEMDSITRRGRDLLSQKLLLPLSHARQLVGTARRVVRGAYSEGMRFRNMSAGWSLEQ
jgi:hypothetical protein